jgi:CRISPR-associated protein Csd2
VEGYISANFAEYIDKDGNKIGTGFSEDDLKLFWQALENMFEHDRSAARGKMTARKLIIFKHDSALGNAPAHKLFELVSVGKNNDLPRAFSDYKITIASNPFAGVTAEVRDL